MNKNSIFIIFFALIVVFLLHSCATKKKTIYDKYGMEVDKESQMPKGLAVGEEAPDFVAMNQEEEEVVLSEILEEHSVVLFFYRGEWCPICNRYLSNFQDSLAFVEAQNVKVIAVTPEKLESSQKIVEKTDAEFIVVNDADESISKKYDVLFGVTTAYQKKIKTLLFTDIAKNNEQEEASLPVPATYIINRKGEIVYRHFDVNYKKRASVKEILANLPTKK
ncbi:MAG: peroxiredoxin family protein [Chitinophagales bacterium]